MERLACERKCPWRYCSINVCSDRDDLSCHIDGTLNHFGPMLNCEYRDGTGGTTQYSTNYDLANISKQTHTVRLSVRAASHRSRYFSFSQAWFSCMPGQANLVQSE